MPDNNGRLDRIEGVLEKVAARVDSIDEAQHLLTDSQKHLLRAQVILTDAQSRTENNLAAVGDSLRALAEAQRDTQANLNALIAVVDDLTRHQPPTEPH